VIGCYEGAGDAKYRDPGTPAGQPRGGARPSARATCAARATEPSGFLTIPPLNVYTTRTPADPKQGTTVATIEGYVTSAEQNGGGRVQLTFHHICDGCDAHSITAANMQLLLDWLGTQVTTGAVAVKTT